MSRNARRAAVLGAGIMGTSTALYLARNGFNVTVYDREKMPMERASRWNEGKVHLGYLYGADPTLRSAKHIFPGGLMFANLLSDLIGTEVANFATTEDDYYFVHKDSLVEPDVLAAKFTALTELLKNSPNAECYLSDLPNSNSHQVPNGELDHLVNTKKIVAGFTVPERSVNTQLLADNLSGALLSDGNIEFLSQSEVTYARAKEFVGGKWLVGLQSSQEEEFDLVVNALWNGRMQIDVTAGLDHEANWSNRYRLSLFIRTERPIYTKSSIICVGAFGDIKNYDNQNFYVSWYPAGLVQDSSDIAPHDPRPFTQEKQQQVITEARKALTEILPDVDAIFKNALEIKVEGGFVFASGQGSISKASSTLHRRDSFGLRRAGNYISIDTGKYSTAPWMANKLVNDLVNN